MSMNPDWLPKQRMITDEEWNSFRERYSSELGFDDDVDFRSVRFDSQLHNERSALLANDNWSLLMPEDSITRMKQAEQPYDEFKQVVKDTIERAVDDIEPQPSDLYLAFDNIATRFNGSSDFNFSQIQNYNTNHDEEGNTTYDNMSVVVRSTNSNNFEDWYIYAPKNPTEVFGSVLSSMTEAARLICEAELEPEQIIRDVACVLEINGSEAPSVSGVTPPQQPISVASVDHSGSGHYDHVDSPKELFGDGWGDIESMRQNLADSNIEPQSISGNIGFWIVTGVKW